MPPLEAGGLPVSGEADDGEPLRGSAPSPPEGASLAAQGLADEGQQHATGTGTADTAAGVWQGGSDSGPQNEVRTSPGEQPPNTSATGSEGESPPGKRPRMGGTRTEAFQTVKVKVEPESDDEAPPETSSPMKMKVEPKSEEEEEEADRQPRKRLMRKTSGSSLAVKVKQEVDSSTVVKGEPDVAVQQPSVAKVKLEANEDGASEEGDKEPARVKDEVKEEIEDGVPGQGAGYIKREVKAEVKREVAGAVRSLLPGHVKAEVKNEAGRTIKYEVKKESSLPRGVKRERFDEGGARVKAAPVKEEPGLAKYRIKCKRAPVKKEVKSEPEDDEPTNSSQAWQASQAQASVAARLPWFILQCKDFQAAKETWAPARPCCLANSFIEPMCPPCWDGKSCYEMLSKEQRRDFRAFVAKTDEQVRRRTIPLDRHLLKLLYPEPRPLSSTKPRGPREKPAEDLPQLKMWPWMRDLDARWWIGCGWILTPDGPKRLAEAGAAPGTEIFQGCKTQRWIQPEDVPEVAPVELSQGVDVARSSSATTAAGDAGDLSVLKPGGLAARIVRHKAKQSGVRNISWHTASSSWCISWGEGGKFKQRFIPLLKYVKLGGKTYEEADAEALLEAISFRESLVAIGKLKPLQASGRGDEEGVSWLPKEKAWDVQLRVKGKLIRGGRFRSRGGSPAEVEEARLAAVARLQELRSKHGLRGDVAEAVACRPRERRESGVVGVAWDAGKGVWHAKIQMSDGKQVSRRFRPKDASPEAVEAARILAVRCRQELEQEREQGLQRVATEVVDPGQMVKRESGVPGVTWEAHACQWHVNVTIQGKQVQRRFRPAGMSPEAVEAARLLAVQCNEELRRQKSGLPLSADGS